MGWDAPHDGGYMISWMHDGQGVLAEEKKRRVKNAGYENYK